MIYLTYNNRGGRSGHQLKNILTTFIFSFFVKNSICVYHPTWNTQNILNNININHIDNIKYDKTIEIKNIIKWHGLGYKSFMNIVNNINTHQDINKNILISINCQACRVHPHTLHNWFIRKIIQEDYYKTKLIPLINRFYYENTADILDIISIHIRRGDIAKEQIINGFNFTYYKKLIIILNKYYDMPINIYSENYNSEDLKELNNIKNVKLFLGGVKELKSDFNSMVRSKILFLSSSSFSTWAAYLSLGKVYYHNNKIKHFGHVRDPDNFYRYKNLTILNKILSNQYENSKLPLPP
jgi:hypothetical protein